MACIFTALPSCPRRTFFSAPFEIPAYVQAVQAASGTGHEFVLPEAWAESITLSLAIVSHNDV